MKQKTYAVITGASQGLGLAFAHEFASRKIPVILVSKAGENLDNICSEIQNVYNVPALFYEADLLCTDELQGLVDYLRRFSVSILVNNVGMGNTGAFKETDLLRIDQMVQLNVRATTWITHLLIPALLQNNSSYILNVSSMASFHPIPLKTVYSASKVYIEYFSRGLYTEYKSKGLHVSSLHPGPMRTNAEVQERIQKHGWFGLIGLKAPETVARKSVTKLLHKRHRIIVGYGNQFHYILLRLLPVWLRDMLFWLGLRNEIK